MADTKLVHRGILREVYRMENVFSLIPQLTFVGGVSIIFLIVLNQYFKIKSLEKELTTIEVNNKVYKVSFRVLGLEYIACYLYGPETIKESSR